MAIPSGSIATSLGSTSRPNLSPKPPISRRRIITKEIPLEMLKKVDMWRSITCTNVEDLGDNQYTLTFDNWVFIEGLVLPPTILESYLYINNVYVKRRFYNIEAGDDSIIVNITENIGYEINPNWVNGIQLNIRATT